MTEINQPLYGVWIPGKGWVRGGPHNAVFADYNKAIAEELAQRLGQRAKVFFVDNALIDLEEQLLQVEREYHKTRLGFWLRRKNHAVSK